MTILEAVRLRLLAIADLTALVGQRIYVLKFPQHAIWPAVRLQLVSTVEPMQLRGSGGFYRGRVQVDAVAEEGDATDPYATARDVLDAAHGDYVGGVSTGLSGWTGSVGSPAADIEAVIPALRIEDYDPDEHRQVRMSQDYFVWMRT